MGGYLVNFAVYTMAMTGLIFFALMVYKKFTSGGVLGNSKSKLLSVEETISLAPRKTLYIVRAGEERFLIAGDTDKTALISKLSDNNSNTSDYLNYGIKNSQKQPSAPANRTRRASVSQQIHPKKSSVDELPEIVNYRNYNSNSNVLQSMIKKINE